MRCLKHQPLYEYFLYVVSGILLLLQYCNIVGDIFQDHFQKFSQHFQWYFLCVYKGTANMFPFLLYNILKSFCGWRQCNLTLYCCKVIYEIPSNKVFDQYEIYQLNFVLIPFDFTKLTDIFRHRF